MQQKHSFSSQRHSVGSIVKLKVSGRMGEPCYLKKYGKPTYLVSHVSADTIVADFEITVPRKPLEPFVPARLKYAYGYWVEQDGAKVLFSRDYKPLWRIRRHRSPERLDPWQWIDKVDEQWFWGPENAPWYNQKRFDEEEARLKSFGVTALPRLVDILPDLIFNPKLKSVGDAVEAFAKRQDSSIKETADGLFRFDEENETKWIKLIGGGFAHMTALFAVHPKDKMRANIYLDEARTAGLTLSDALRHASKHLENATGWPTDIDKQLARVRRFYEEKI